MKEKIKFNRIHHITYALLEDDMGNILEGYGWGDFQENQGVTIWFDSKYDKIKFKKRKAKYLT